MGLPRQQGPFPVGAIDLEIPVRKPRSFASDIVEPSRINRPSGKKSAASTGPSSRERGQQGDAEGSQSTQVDDGGDDGDNDGLPDWSPFAHGSKTSTLHLSTVLFTIYYPCAGTDEELAKNHRRVAWLGRPKTKGVQALVSYLSQYGLAGPFAALPASPALATLLAAKMHVWGGAPLADPDDPRARAPPPQNRPTVGLFGHEPASFPVIVFSHGLAGSRLAYSQYCSELASQGVIVAAIEHRDGSGIASMVRPPIDPRMSNKKQSAEEVREKSRSKLWKARHHHPKSAVPYFTFEAVGLRSFPTDPNEKEVGMRQAQLAMRCAEIEECLHVLKRIANGEGADVVSESTRTLTTKLCGRPTTRKGLPDSLLSDPLSLKSWQGKLDIDYPSLAGHSFGGATAFELLRGENPPFPFAMILDPWVEPIVIDDNDPRPLRAPVYVMNSESFTLWGTHFEKVKRLVSDAQQANREHRGWLMTLAASEHLSFSDYPLLLPRVFRTSISPHSAIEIYTRATLVQIGLLRQRYRERAGQPGVKFGDPRKLDKERSKDETLGVRQNGKGVTEGKRTASPEQMESSESKPPPAGQEAAGGDESQPQSNWAHFAEHERTTAENEMVKAVQSGQDPIRANVGSDEPTTDHAGDQKREGPPFPSASDDKYRSQLENTQDPVFQQGEEREDTMKRLKESKDEAGDTLLANKARRQGKHVPEDEHKDHTPHGVVTYRTPSGGMASRPRRSDEFGDLVTDPTQIEDEQLRRDLDPDAEVVHASLKDLSESQGHKKHRTRSLAGLMYRSMGFKPSLGKTGAILIHDLRKRGPHEEEQAGEEGEEAGGVAPSVAQNVEERTLE